LQCVLSAVYCSVYCRMRNTGVAVCVECSVLQCVLQDA